MKMTCISTLLLLASTLSAADYQYPSQTKNTSEENSYRNDVTIKVANDPKLGKILTDSKGMTLYMFTLDKSTSNESTCYDDCAVSWPPLLVSSGKPVLASGTAGTLDTIKRRDQTMQVTYNGMPLYYYVKDKKPGDVYGQNVDNKWFVIKPK